jgi:hypothetical protein
VSAQWSKPNFGHLTDNSPPFRIYSYLLDGEFVHTKRTWSRKEFEDNFDNDRTGPQAYHFHTNILGVNRAIHDEAEELLYKRNIFVVLSYKYFGLGNENAGLFWLPVVSNRHAPRMKSHSVRIHVSPGTAGVRDPMISGNASLQSAIFLARDLEVFCLIMTTAGTMCTQTALTVALHRNGAGAPMIDYPLPLAKANRITPQFRCELRNNKYRQIDAATQRQLLAPMARILAPSQRVSFEGIVFDIQEVERFKQTMSPTLNCIRAFKWTFFEAMSLAKDVADAVLLHDDIEYVMTLYHTIALTLGVFSFIQESLPGQRQAFFAACPEAAEASDILALEALVNAGCSAAKVKDGKVLLQVGEGIQAYMRRRAEENRSWENIPPQLERLCYSVMMWKNLYCGVEGHKATIREVVEYLTSSTRHPHLAHDASILSRHPDQGALVTRKHLPFNKCSAFQLPLPRTAFHNPLLEQYKERFKGWLDLDLLRSLAERQKQDINNLQMRYRIRVTAFDELDL